MKIYIFAIVIFLSGCITEVSNNQHEVNEPEVNNQQETGIVIQETIIEVHAEVIVQDIADTAETQKRCDDIQPMQFKDGVWVKNGGACNYGCDNTTGMCNCKVPTGRFIRTFGTDYLGSGTSDMKTGYHWTDATMLTLDFASAQSICTQEAGMVLPSLSDIQKTVIIQQSPATHCRPDFDITLFNVDDRTTAIWTSTPDYVNGGYFTINIQTGEVDTAQVTESRSTVCVFTN